MENQDEFLYGEIPGGPQSPDFQDQPMDTTERDCENEGIKSPSGGSGSESGELSSDESIHESHVEPMSVDPNERTDVAVTRDTQPPESPRSSAGEDDSSSYSSYDEGEVKKHEPLGPQSPVGDAPGSPDPELSDSDGYYESETGEVHSPSGRTQSPRRGPQTPEMTARDGPGPQSPGQIDDSEGSDGEIEKKSSGRHGGHKANISGTSLDDHGELDYDEEVEDVEGHRTAESAKSNHAKPEKEEGEHDTEDDEDTDGDGEIISDDGEVQDDDDCEEGEIKEPTERRERFQPPMCKFFQRGSCTWGNNCRFIHPGSSDKGNYSLIERQGPDRFMSRPRQKDVWRREEVAPVEEPLPPPPPPEEPRPESAWERGLRTAKELMKKATKKKETEVDFEEKKMNLSLDERENNKENEKRGAASPERDPYYDGWEDEDYYNTKEDENWGTVPNNQFENFEVRWRDPGFSTPPGGRNQHPAGYRDNRNNDKNREKRYNSPSRERRYEGDIVNRDKEVASMGAQKTRADEWRDPWRRSKSPPKRRDSSSRSRSRGRRRKRSYSNSSSYSSSSYSSRSRSRSSSYSSYSSRSSYSRSSSSSRSRSPTPDRKRGTALGASGRKPMAVKQNEPPRSSGPVRGGKDVTASVRRPPAPPVQTQRPPPRTGSQPTRTGGQAAPPKAAGQTAGSRQPPTQRGSTNQRGQGGSTGTSLAVPQRGRAPNKPHPIKAKKRGGSVSSSDSSISRSRSRSKSFSRSLSKSSRSSSASSSSSGSADSDNLYRDLGNQARPATKTKKKTRNYRDHPKDRKQLNRDIRPLPREIKPKVAVPSAVAMQGKKDPLKTLGQKSNIKLTLINKPSEKSGTNGMPSKKRTATMVEGPPVKKPARSPVKPSAPERAQKSTSNKPEKSSKTMSRSKPEPVPSKAPPKVSLTIKKSEPPMQRPVISKSSSAAAPSKKKSTSSRREELLQQLKAVEDAIARKRAKMQ